MTVLKAYEVEYRVKIIAYGKTAKEAQVNGAHLMLHGHASMDGIRGEFDNPEDYAVEIAELASYRVIGTPRRKPGEDLDFNIED